MTRSKLKLGINGQWMDVDLKVSGDSLHISQRSFLGSRGFKISIEKSAIKDISQEEENLLRMEIEAPEGMGLESLWFLKLDNNVLQELRKLGFSF